MYCNQCQTLLPKDSQFCLNCGSQLNQAEGGSMGYSQRIKGPFFARYMRDTNRWSAIFK